MQKQLKKSRPQRLFDNKKKYWSREKASGKKFKIREKSLLVLQKN